MSVPALSHGVLGGTLGCAGSPLPGTASQRHITSSHKNLHGDLILDIASVLPVVVLCREVQMQVWQGK